MLKYINVMFISILLIFFYWLFFQILKNNQNSFITKKKRKRKSEVIMCEDNFTFSFQTNCFSARRHHLCWKKIKKPVREMTTLPLMSLSSLTTWPILVITDPFMQIWVPIDPKQKKAHITSWMYEVEINVY